MEVLLFLTNCPNIFMLHCGYLLRIHVCLCVFFIGSSQRHKLHFISVLFSHTWHLNEQESTEINSCYPEAQRKLVLSFICFGDQLEIVTISFAKTEICLHQCLMATKVRHGQSPSKILEKPNTSLSNCHPGLIIWVAILIKPR